LIEIEETIVLIGFCVAARANGLLQLALHQVEN
jgi:hypothetical protein